VTVQTQYYNNTPAVNRTSLNLIPARQFSDLKILDIDGQIE